MVFASSDHLHAKAVPLFLCPNQDFVFGSALKADLARLDQHYSALPEEVRNRGVSSFAGDPPLDDSFLITRLWDKHLKRISNESVPVESLDLPDSDSLDHLVVERMVYARKGKWKRFPPEGLPGSHRFSEVYRAVSMTTK